MLRLYFLLTTLLMTTSAVDEPLQLGEGKSKGIARPNSSSKSAPIVCYNFSGTWNGNTDWYFLDSVDGGNTHSSLHSFDL